MRLSEKTIELNICAQINQYLNRRIVWFGLTQRQEAKMGFDTAFELGGRILIFQFKASNNVLRSTGARRFYLEHYQLLNLINLTSRLRRSVFYVFPMIGSTKELNDNHGDFLDKTWLLDVSTLPDDITVPTKKAYPHEPRKNPLHYADVLPPSVTIRSEPIKSNVELLSDLTKINFEGSEGLNEMLLDYSKNYDKLFDLFKPLGRNFKMGVLM